MIGIGNAMQSLELSLDSGQTGQNKELVVMRNGALADPVTGRIVKGPAGGAELAKLRWQRAQAEARAGMAEAGRKLGHGKTASAAWQAICEHAATQAMAHPTPRESVVAARFVGEASGYLVKASAEQSSSSPALSLQLNSDALRLLLDRLASR